MLGIQLISLGRNKSTSEVEKLKYSKIFYYFLTFFHINYLQWLFGCVLVILGQVFIVLLVAYTTYRHL